MLHRENVSKDNRIRRLVGDIVENLSLDLSGLTVYTEAATGAYLYTPILAAVAGAEKVFAVAGDSSFAPKETVADRVRATARDWGVESAVDVVLEKREAEVSRADVVTNTGFVRPIDRRMVEWMKPTAVVPLMWEPWELEGHVDLEACQEQGILVMGTDESEEPTDMYPYAGFLALKLLFELDLEGYKTETVLLGSGDGLAKSIHERFQSVGIAVEWFSDRHDGSRPYSDASEYVSKRGNSLDAILLAEHHDDRLLVGAGGVIDFDTILEYAPGVSVGVISGNVDAEALEESGLNYHPETIRPPRSMSYQAYHLGPRGPLELYGAGLKVGEEMARRRLDGLSPFETEREVAGSTRALAVDGLSYE